MTQEQPETGQLLKLANENRLRQLTRTEADKDGLNRGFGLSVDHPDVARLANLVERLKQDHAMAEDNLRQIMRAHPLGQWCKQTAGVGEKRLARLLAAVGDPFWNDLHDRPRTVSELWAYCGYDVRNGVAARRKRGELANWNDAARMRARLIALSCVMAKSSPYNPVYYQAREKYADGKHDYECIPCGTKGRPAQPGTALRDGHKHARALRAVAKEVLKDLWRESKRLHEVQGEGVCCMNR